MSGDVSVKEILPMMSDGFRPHVTEEGHPLASARRIISQYIRCSDCVSGQGFLDAACGCQGRTKTRPEWRRKIRPSGRPVACLKVAVRVG